MTNPEQRANLMNQADLEHVNHLHRIGRQLAVLKRLYQSYELIIDKILQQRAPPLKRSQAFSTPLIGENYDNTPGVDSMDRLGLYLTSGAKYRFERLRDRIRLYVLSAIQESIDLKDSLLSMNFNLISIKESNAVERLTRITILLAKATILFIPVSLVTQYFSVQIPDTHFTVAAFWITFAVVLVLSFIGLWAFGRLSGTTEGQMVYRPIHTIFMDLLRRSLGRAKEKIRE